MRRVRDTWITRCGQNFFRAGHAHAGVIVILSLVCQLLADAALLPDREMDGSGGCARGWLS